MYPISNAVKALFDSEQAQVLRITGTDRNGASVNITDADVMDGSFNIDRYSCNGNMLEIGTATAAELTMRLNNYDGKFDNIVFEGTELFVELGIADWTLESPEVTYIPCGYFVPDEQPRTLSIITIHALDRMMRFDNTVPMMEPWTTENGTPITTEDDDIIYFTASLSFPATVANLAAQLADGCAVPFTQDISGFPNASRLIEAMPSTQQRITFRNMLQWCAGLMGANAWIDWDGALRFSWYNNLTGYASTTDTRYSSDLYEDALVITGVKYTDSDDENTVYLAGNEGYPLDISGNELVDEGDIAAILNNIYLKIGNFAYTPFTASVVSAPYLWPMDRLTFTDKNGTGHVSSLTNVNFGLNGTTNLQAVGESKQSIKGTSPASFTAMQAQALKQVYRSTSTAAQEMVNHATEMITGGLGGYVVLGIDESTGQTEEILIMDSPNKQTAVNVWRFNQGGLGHSSNGYEGPFNDIALTADGQINANMITTGTLDANRISSNSISIQQLTQEARSNLVASTSVKDQFYLSTSSAEPVGGQWQDTQPTWTGTGYIWTRVETSVTTANGTTTTAHSVPVYDSVLTEAVSQASAASSQASSAAAAVGGANYREQRIYISKASGTSSVPAYLVWVTNTAGVQNTWTTTRPVYNTTYPVLFTAVQRQTVNESGGTSCTCTQPVIDQTTTVIDGGHITTGSIDAGRITTGQMSADRIYAGTISDVDGHNYWNLNTGVFRMTNGSIDIGDFEVDTLGRMTCTEARISGALTSTLTDSRGTFELDFSEGTFDYRKNNTTLFRVDATLTDLYDNPEVLVVSEGNAEMTVGIDNGTQIRMGRTGNMVVAASSISLYDLSSWYNCSTGTFLSGDGQSITVTNGFITDIGGVYTGIKLDAGSVQFGTVSPNSVATTTVYFNNTFGNPPVVVVSFSVQGSSSGYSAYGNMSCGVLPNSITSTSFTCVVYNNRSSGPSTPPKVSWIAYDPS